MEEIRRRPDRSPHGPLFVLAQRCNDARVAATFDWNDLRYLLAVARHGRLLSAARALRVQHTTVGRRLAALEKAVGAPIFFRTTRGHVLTDEGRRVLEVAEQMERAASAMPGRVREGRTDASGRIRVACVESWAALWLAPLLPELARRHPRLRIEIRTGNQRSDLAKGEAEVALRVPRPTEPDLVTKRLAESSIGLYATRALAERHRPALDAEEPSGRGVPLCCYTDDFAFLQSAPWFAKVRREADLRLETTSTFTLLAAGRIGHGVIAVPRFLVRDEPLLVQAASRDLARHEIFAVTHVAFRRDPRVRALLDFFEAHAHGFHDT